MKRLHLVAVCSALLLVGGLLAPALAGAALSGAPVLVAATAAPSLLIAQEKKKKGKVVKATLVPAEPAEESDPSEPAEEAEDVAEAEDDASADVESKADRKAAEREARKAEKQAEKQAEKEAEQAEKDAEEARRQAEREEREAAAALAAADREAAERERRERAAAARQAEGERPVASAAPEPVPTSPARSAAAVDVEPPPRAEPPAARSAVEPPAPRPRDVVSERIQVREVLLDVLVTDRRGNPVVGLGPDDFVVTEDGEQREVTSVTYYGGVGELSGSGVEGETRTDRYFILFFHDQKQAAPFLTAAQLETGRWAKRWIEQLLPNDQVAVMGYDVRLKLYQDFTRDQAAIIQAIDDASLGKKEPDRWKTVSEPELDRDSPSLAVNLPTGKTLARQSRKLQQALELVGEAAEGIAGRKNLVLFSVGFGDIDDFGLYTPDPRYYPPMKQALNNGNVAVYAIDTVGSRRGNPGARDINDALSAIANDTGGHYYSTFINAVAPLEQVAEDNIGYYLLSYRSEYEAGTSGYQEVKVDTTDRSFQVRARKGYKYGSDS